MDLVNGPLSYTLYIREACYALCLGKLIMQLSNNADIHPTNRHKKTEEEGQEKRRAS